VVGSSSAAPAARVFLGSRASRIIRHAPVPVVVVPREALTVAKAASLHPRTPSATADRPTVTGGNQVATQSTPLDRARCAADVGDSQQRRKNPDSATPGRNAASTYGTEGLRFES
jgi:Universal stress protein family